MKVKPIIMAGGKGSRLWPLSRQLFPKQFIAINDKHSLMQRTLITNSSFGKATVIITQEYSLIAKEQIKILGINADLIIEPTSKNTALCAIISVIQAKKSGYDMVMLLPSDHYIDDKSEYLRTIDTALHYAAKFGICTIGITPDFPSTEYGYIKIKEKIAKGIYHTKKFIEKPNIRKAKYYFNHCYHQYLWNSGIYICNINYIIEQYKLWQITLLQCAYNALHMANTEGNNIILSDLSYANIKPISFDYAIIENISQMIMVIAQFKWYDLGNWHSLWHMQTKDAEGNYYKGDVISLYTKNSYIVSDNKLAAVIGINDAVIINTENALLIVSKSHVEKVKYLIAHMMKIGRQEL